MAETTENYGLLKPEETDYYSIEIQNENMDAIDAALKAQADGIATKASADVVSVHTSDMSTHVTVQEKAAWNGKADSTSFTAHTGDTGIHVNAAKQTVWNNKANGNSATWVATAVTDPDSNNSSRLTIPNFVFTEGCQVTFKAITKPISNNPWFSLLCGGVWYAVRDSRGNLLDEDAWIIGANVTVTLTAQSFNPPQAGWRTAFFKGGAGEKITYTVYCQPTAPSAQSGIWLKTPSVVKYKRILFDANPWAAGSWKTNSGVPDSSENCLNGIEVNGIIYARNDQSGSNAALLRLQTSNNTWLAPIVIPATHERFGRFRRIANVEGSLFSFYQDSNGANAYAGKYTPSTGTWTVLANAQARQNAEGGVVAYKKNIYLANGASPTGTIYFHVYNTTTNSYTQLANHVGYVSQGIEFLNNLYFGNASTLPYSTLPRYAISSNTWSRIAYSSEVKDWRNQELLLVGDEIFIIGGNLRFTNDVQSTQKVLAYKPNADISRWLPDLPIPIINNNYRWVCLYNNLVYFHYRISTEVYSLLSKTYEQDPTVVINENAGDMNYRASIIYSDMLTYSPTWFRDVFLYQGGQLTKPELHYRNGHSSWQKIRNAE